jgi:hypothetical protein
MYEHTFDDGTGWNLDDMEKLSDYVQGLLESFLIENDPTTPIHEID